MQINGNVFKVATMLHFLTINKITFANEDPPNRFLWPCTIQERKGTQKVQCFHNWFDISICGILLLRTPDLNLQKSTAKCAKASWMALAAR